jgi:putative redox protein
MDTVKARWNGKRRFVGSDEAGHGVVMDASEEHKGEGSGARPLELLLYAFAGCTGIDVVSILEKQRQDVIGLEIEVEASQREERPKYYDRIHVRYVLTGTGLKESAVRRAISLSEEKYCSVGGILRDDVEITSSYELIEA